MNKLTLTSQQKYYLRLMKIFAIKTEIWRMIMEDDIHVKNTFH